jgi:hypothetical protein
LFGGKITKNSGVSQVTHNHPNSYYTTIPDTAKMMQHRSSLFKIVLSNKPPIAFIAVFFAPAVR